ncbi:unnamed protein product [Didymodactylos carnosus]|uniref:Plasma glutamate carboxypeptidase n=1 Tax=Didymodactylos carnosus TaxID=1234261 RepID=A0A8S2S9E9_9BILA|nr:unnamed protein product [Didymodactylos carnosus]CAF4209873.1 unnamed protein product [Didymodactylos carnosus]
MYLLLILLILSLTPLTNGKACLKSHYRSGFNEIRDHKQDAERIISYATQGKFKGVTYSRLANFTDNIGSRLCGSESLEKAVNWTRQAMLDDGLDNVHIEEVSLPHWVRGQEYVQLLEPRQKGLAMLGLGNSVGTGPNGITANVLVVQTFDELEQQCSKAKDKIVVYNSYCDWSLQPLQCYGVTVQYRSQGASRAAKCGALAALVKSAASFSIYSPHTGMMSYDPSINKIPAAALSIEDAEMLWRFQQRGQMTKVKLYMEAQTLPNVVGHNVVAEIKGSTYPEQTVLVSGHLDSWDVGQDLKGR